MLALFATRSPGLLKTINGSISTLRAVDPHANYFFGLAGSAVFLRNGFGFSSIFLIDWR
jgi:hypothetical protein